MPQLGKIKKEVIITQDHKRFNGSSYAEEFFTVVMLTGIRGTIAQQKGQKDAKKEWEDLKGEGDVPSILAEKNLKGEGDAPSILVGKHLVISRISDWSGFLDEDGNEMEPDDRNKSDMYDYDPQFFDLLYAAYLDEVNPNWEKALKREPQREPQVDEVDEAMGEHGDTSNGSTHPEEVQLEANPAGDVPNP